MSINLTIGRKELTCKNNIGGLKDIYFSNYPIDIILNDDDIVIDATPLIFYKYEANNLCNFTQNIVDDKKTSGLKYYNQEINVVVKHIDAEFNKEVERLIKKRFYILCHTKIGESYLFGTEHGVSYDTGNAVFGEKFADFQGYNLKFTAKEHFFANYISGSTLENPFGCLTGATVVVTGITNILSCLNSVFIAENNCVASGITLSQGDGWASSDKFSNVNGFLWLDADNSANFHLSGLTGYLWCDS